MKNNPLPEVIIAKTESNRYMVFNTKDIITSNLIHRGFYEKDVHDVSEKIISQSSNGLIFDIGANLGSFSIPLAKNFEDHVFIAFEPQRIIYYQLCGNIFLNELKNVHAFNFGLSLENKTIIANVPKYSDINNLGAFSLDKQVRETDSECDFADEQQEFVLKTLDSIDASGVCLIKMDVEGMELEILKGGLQFLKKNNYPPIIFEAWTYKSWYQPRRKELYSFLRGVGYEITQFDQNNLAQHESRVKIDFTV